MCAGLLPGIVHFPLTTIVQPGGRGYVFYSLFDGKDKETDQSFSVLFNLPVCLLSPSCRHMLTNANTETYTEQPLSRRNKITPLKNER